MTSHTPSPTPERANAPGLPGSRPRRGFLRSLVSLPLIGGSVSLIGAPTAVAALVTPQLLANYETWLAQEALRLAHELRPASAAGYLSTIHTAAYAWHQAERDLVAPSSRAALVLSAVGCDWREGGR